MSSEDNNEALTPRQNAKIRDQLLSKQFIAPPRPVDDVEKGEAGEMNASEKRPPPDINVEPPSRRASDAKSDGLPWLYRFFGFGDWLPRIRSGSAFLLLLINIFLPGIGTLFFSLKWLDGEDFAVATDLKQRWSVASIGVLYGLAQFILWPFLFGWFWAIYTGVIALKQAKWIEIMDAREAKKKEGMKTIDEDEDVKEEKIKKPAKVKPQRKRRPTPPPTPVESPPPGWVYRLYPYGHNEEMDAVHTRKTTSRTKSRSRLSSRNTGTASSSRKSPRVSPTQKSPGITPRTLGIDMKASPRVAPKKF